MLSSPTDKDETAVHCCDPALPILAMLVSRNVFHAVSALQSIVSIRLIEKCEWLQLCLTPFPKISQLKPNLHTVAEEENIGPSCSKWAG